VSGGARAPCVGRITTALCRLTLAARRAQVRPLLVGVPAAGLRAALELLLDSALQRSPRGGRLGVAAADAPGGGLALDITDCGDVSMGARMRAALRGAGGGAPADPLPDARSASPWSAYAGEGLRGGAAEAAGAAVGMLPAAGLRAGGDGAAAGAAAGGAQLAGAAEGAGSAETMLQRISRGLPASAGAVTLELGRAALHAVGGRLTVECAPGVGTRMRVWLPPPRA